MSKCVGFDAEGRILAFAKIEGVDAAAQAESIVAGYGFDASHRIFVADDVAGDTHWIDDGAEELRPEIAPSVTWAGVGDDLSVAGLPDGCAWRIIDVTDPALPEALSASGVVDGSFTETMDDAGRYRLEIDAPWPTRPYSLIVEVA